MRKTVFFGLLFLINAYSFCMDLMPQHSSEYEAADLYILADGKHMPQYLEVLLKEMKKNNGNIDPVDDEGLTPFLKTLKFNCKPEARLLYNYGARCDKRDFQGNTALHFALAQGNSEIVRLFLRDRRFSGEEVNRDGQTALHVVAMDPQSTETESFAFAVAECVQLFLSEISHPYVLIDKQNLQGETPLQIAEKKKNLDLLAVFSGYVQISKEYRVSTLITFSNLFKKACQLHVESQEITRYLQKQIQEEHAEKNK